MSAPLKAIDGNADLAALMTDLAAKARAAARVLALAPPEQKNRALLAIERAIRANPAPAFCTDLATNQLFYMRAAPIRCVDPADLGSIVAPAWLIVPR